jgi:hypothetical protein
MVIVVVFPCLQFNTGLMRCRAQCDVQFFISEFAVEALEVAVLLGQSLDFHTTTAKN